MRYIQGFVIAVPEGSQQTYLDHASAMAPMFEEFGMIRMVEAWGNDVPDGSVTDFRRAVKAQDGETVVFSWIEYPSKAACDEANERMMSDPRTMAMGDIPFDGRRMIFAGFEAVVDEGTTGGTGYVDGCLVPVPRGNRAAYTEFAARAAAVFRDHGAIRVVESWGEALSDGEVTDFKRAVQATPDEATVFSWIEWPSKADRDAGWEQVMADPRLAMGTDQPFDGKRMVYGGFVPILDTATLPDA